MRVWFLLMLVCSQVVFNGSAALAEPLRLATFQLDVTPPLGSALCDGLVPPASSIDDPLYTRGIVILGAGEPIVLCAVDFVGIGNGGHDAWRETLARAAGTSVSRVAVQSLHQHDAPGCDFDAEELLAAHGAANASCDMRFSRELLRRLESIVRESVAKARPFDQIGVGHATVERVASNRRILGDDGKVKIIRYSSTKDLAAIAAPEGTIDPDLKLISFWNGDVPLVSMTFYATHPQSHYGKGAVSADIPGLARAQRDRDQPEIFHLHFNGAGGNVTAGKYNDGSPQARIDLTERLAAGMTKAWNETKKKSVSSSDIHWRVQPVAFPLSERLKKLDNVERILNQANEKPAERARAARDLAYAHRVASGRTIELTCLEIGPALILNLPGETFIEYQLAAQQIRPDKTVCTAAYGDYGPGYIGTTVSYSQGGYETGPVSRTSPDVEAVYLDAIRKLLK